MQQREFSIVLLLKTEVCMKSFQALFTVAFFLLAVLAGVAQETRAFDGLWL